MFGRKSFVDFERNLNKRNDKKETKITFDNLFFEKEYFFWAFSAFNRIAISRNKISNNILVRIRGISCSSIPQ